MTYIGNDFYCDVVMSGKISVLKEYESNKVLAFHHTKPHWPVHIVVVPKKHIRSFTTMEDAEDVDILYELFSVLQRMAKKVEQEQGAARVITNLGKYQDSKHLHFHVCSGDPFADANSENVQVNKPLVHGEISRD